MSKVKAPPAPWTSGFCGPTAQDWQHDHCHGGHTPSAGGWIPCVCTCHQESGLDEEIERLCIVLHDAYEAAAAEVGWETQARSRVPWPDVPEANKATMRIAVRALLEAL